MFVTEYVCELDWHGALLPVMLLVGSGALLTAIERFVAVPVPQRLEGTTEILPLFEPTVTKIEFVPCPELMVVPEGTLQVKDIPGISSTE